jgi:hypothetical protein
MHLSPPGRAIGRRNRDFQALHDAIKGYRPTIAVPKHESPSWRWSADDPHIAFRAGQLQEYARQLLAVASIIPDPVTPSWRAFRRTVDAFFEADFVARHAAVGNLETVRFLVETEGVDASACDQACSTGLHYAVAFNHRVVAEYLCQKGVSPHRHVRFFFHDSCIVVCVFVRL